jgi:hypothetical protein
MTCVIQRCGRFLVTSSSSVSVATKQEAGGDDGENAAAGPGAFPPVVPQPPPVPSPSPAGSRDAAEDCDAPDQAAPKQKSKKPSKRQRLRDALAAGLANSGSLWRVMPPRQSGPSPAAAPADGGGDGGADGPAPFAASPLARRRGRFTVTEERPASPRPAASSSAGSSFVVCQRKGRFLVSHSLIRARNTSTWY